MRRIGAVIVVAAVLGAGCSAEPAPGTGGGAASGAGARDGSVAEATLPATLFLAAPPQGARPVGAVKASAKEGDRVVVRGKVGGSRKPFMEGRAVFMVVDPENATSCENMPGDSCKTPWDYCCEPKEVLVAQSATLQVSDAEGRPLRAALEGKGSLAPLSLVVAEGVVGPRPDAGTLVIHVTGIHVEGR